MPSPLFDPDFYRSYSDLSDLSPQQLEDHWLNHGIPEGRLGSKEHFATLYPDFHAPSYRRLNPDTAGLSEIDLLRHWHDIGSKADLLAADTLNGVNLFGYLDESFGIAQNAHAIAEALQTAAIPCEHYTVNSAGTGASDSTYNPDKTPRYQTNIVCINPDNIETLFLHYPYRKFFQNKRNIAVWLWEMSSLSEQFKSFAGFFDEIWTPSHFCQDTMASALPLPVRHLPIPSRNNPANADNQSQKTTSDRPFTFLFICDLLSSYHRKNPDGLIRAFHAAFGENPKANVQLIIKLRNHEAAGVTPQFPFLTNLTRTLGIADRVSLLTELLSTEEMDTLFENSDCYVSLHRAEGFGLTILEALLRHKQVIVTNYSGNLDFCTADNAFLVPYTLQPPPPEDPVYGKMTSQWANPDEAVAAQCMQDVFAGDKRADCAAELARRYSNTTCSTAVADLLRCHGIRPTKIH